MNSKLMMCCLVSEGIQISINDETVKDGMSWLKKLLGGAVMVSLLGGNAAHIPFLDQILNGIRYGETDVQVMSDSYTSVIEAQQAKIEQLESGCK